MWLRLNRLLLWLARLLYVKDCDLRQVKGGMFTVIVGCTVMVAASSTPFDVPAIVVMVSYWLLV